MAQPRQIEYEENQNYKILPRIPVIIKIDGRSFSKITKHTQKPFCHKIMALLNETMLALVKQIDGVVFGYQYSDKMLFVLRNDRSQDEDPWFGNHIQQQASVAASMATYHFMRNLWSMDDPPNLEGDITFHARVFGVPSIKEACNYLIYRQWMCLQNAINEAVYSVLWPRYGKKTAAFLDEKSLDQRKQILEDAGLDLDNLPSAYRLGSAAYVVPTIVHTTQGQINRQKWTLDFDIPLLSKSQDWLRTILTTGSDIFRPERDYDSGSN